MTLILGRIEREKEKRREQKKIESTQKLLATKPFRWSFNAFLSFDLFVSWCFAVIYAKNNYNFFVSLNRNVSKLNPCQVPLAI